MGSSSTLPRPPSTSLETEVESFTLRRATRIPHERIPPAPGQRPPVALILSDYNELQILFEKLQMIRAPIVTATDGAIGLRLIETAHPAVVVLDLWLPLLNGLEVLRRRSTMTPTFLVAEFSSPQLRCEAVANGAVGLIVRPVDADRVCARIGPYVTRAPRAGATIWAVDEIEPTQ